MRKGIGAACALLILVPLGVPLSAQDYPPQDYPPQSAPMDQPGPALNQQQIDTMVAPIALYPDPLLSQVLVACTYPQEVADAWQWVQQNRGLQGQQLLDAARQMNWDPSVQALVAFPDALGRLASNMNWTRDLGNAFLAQQGDVMASVQRLRAEAQAAGRLSSNAQQTVMTDQQSGQTAIEIVPADPQVIYVPQYNPEYIWGPPLWGYYPSLYYPSIGFGFGFGRGIFVGSYFGGWGGWGGWGWHPNWFGRTVIVNGGFFNRYGFRNYYAGGYGYRGGVWAHNPVHRMGVPYSSPRVATRFGGSYAGSRYQSAPRAFSGNSYGGSRYQSAAPRTYGGGNTYGGNRYQSAPAQSAPRSFTPQAGRSFNGGSAPAVRQSPSYGNGYSGGTAPAYRQSPNFGPGAFRSAPSNGGSAPAMRQAPSAPSYGGSRSFGGSSPRSFGGGGGGFSAPRSYSGGGNSGAFSAPRSYSGGGNSGGSRSFGGGGGSRSFGGGGGSRPSGGGGGGHSSGGGHGRR